jgi:hypothetical protein
MHKSPYLLTLTVLFICSCSAQNKNTRLKDISYCTASSNRWVAEIKLRGDSLIQDKKNATDIIDQDKYEVIAEEKEAEYFLVYVKKTPVQSPGNRLNIPQLKPIRVFVFSFSDDRDKLYVLRTLGYTSVEEARMANALDNLKDKYFTTWYSQTAFSAYIRNPDLLNADKTTTQKVLDSWVGEMKGNADKVRNTHTGDIYGAGYGLDNLSKVLINHNLSPLADLTDLSKKTSEYHIRTPVVSVIHKGQVQSGYDTSHTKNTDVIIDEPVKIKH